VEEVLAVGDADFQKRCLGKMSDVAVEGRTVLFVSHNMSAVQTLCTHGILLESGEVILSGSAAEAVSTYLGTIEQKAQQEVSKRTDRKGRGQIRLTKVAILGGSDPSSGMLATGHPARFEFQLSEIPPGMLLEYVDFTIYDLRGQAIVYFNSAQHGPGNSHDPGIGPKVVCEIDELLLVPGRYRINVGIKGNAGMQDHVEAAAFFDVEEGHVQGRPVVASGQRLGSAYFPHRWALSASG
jgi:lipopolysaccharide transport system ATP-binding protein